MAQAPKEPPTREMYRPDLMAIPRAAVHRLVRCAALTAAALIVVSCSPEDGGYACSAVGYIPSIEVTGFDAAAPAATDVVLRFCEGKVCRESRGEVSDGKAYVALDDLGLGEARPGREVGVGAGFIDASGDMGGTDRLYQVPLVETEPNGPGCGTITSGSLDLSR